MKLSILFFVKIPQKDGYGEAHKVPYSYGFFHFVFATGAMYFAMLFVGWNSHQIMHKYDTSCEANLVI